MLKSIYRKLRSIEKRILDKRQKEHDNLVLQNRLATYSNEIATLAEIPVQKKKNILFFVPEAGVQPHFISSSIIAKNLEAQGYNVFFVRCFDVFDRCPTLSMYNFATENVSKTDKQKICATCIEIHKDYLGKYNLNYLDIRNFISKEELNKITLLLENAPEDLRNFVYDGIDFGKLTAYEMVLNTKLSNFDAKMSKHNRIIWLQLIQSSLVAYILTIKLYKHYAFDVLLSHNFYAHALGALLAAKTLNIPHYHYMEAAHINVNRSMYIITSTFFWEDMKLWAKWHNLALLPQQIQENYKDLINHFSAIGSHQYSPSATFGSNEGLLQELNLPKNKKILVAYTSSEDESLGYNNLASAMGLPQIDESQNAFTSQIDWLSAVCEFVEQSEEYYFIIRLHPRLAKNKRDDKVSTHYEDLKKIFTKPFKNVRIIWSEEQISSYKLFDFADVVLVSWSSISIDAGRLGVPLLSYTKRIPTFPIDERASNFVTIASSKADYFEKIAQLVQEKPTIQKISSAIRWYNMRNLATAIDMDDIVVATQQILPNFVLSREAQLIADVVEGKTTILEENHRRQVSIQNSNTQADEITSIQKYLRRFIHFNITGDSLTEKDVILQHIYTQDFENLSITDRYNPFKAFLLTNGSEIKYIYVGKEYKLYSPLCAKLSELCINY